ncbi:neprilysin-like isoform X2 [Prorops nasuta]|uniref:neprilysin-like isoform X2 n=1 Tax=Prorops nasuta TaxID=863751 RepID=UPI0034CF108B
MESVHTYIIKCLRAGILEARAEADDILPVKLAKKWYKACMNEEASSDKGLSSIVSIVSRIGGWPLAMEYGEWDLIDKPFKIVDKYYTNIIAKSSLFAYTVIPKSWSDECNKSYIEIAMPILPFEGFTPLSREMFYASNSFYRKIIIRAAKRIANKTETTLSEEKLIKDVDDLVNFENKLHKILTIEDTEEEEEEEEEEGLNIPSGGCSSDKDKDNNYESMCDDGEEEESKKNNNECIAANKIRKTGMFKKHDQTKHKHKKHKYNETLNKNPKTRKNIRQKNFLGKMKRLLFRLKMSQRGSSNRKNSQQADNLKRQKRNIVVNEMTFEHKNVDFHELLDPVSLRSKFLTNKQNKVVLTNKNNMYKLNKASENDDSMESNSNSRDSKEEDINASIDDGEEKNETLNCISTSEDNDCNNSENNSDEDFSLDELLFEKLSNEMTELIEESFENLFEEIGIDGDDVDVELYINNNQLVEYFNLLEDTPNEVIVNYVHWSFISRMFALTFDMLDMLFQIQKQINSSKIAPRWYRCVKDIKINQTISYEYVKKYFPKEVSKVANTMIDTLKTATKEEIERSTWMNDDMKSDALEKVDNMKKNIGYPEWLDNNTAVETYYKGLKITSQYFDNALSFERYTNLRELQILTKEENEDDVWGEMRSFTANGVFYMNENALAIPAADFQFPLFSTEYPDALNFGLLGYIISHEVSHGFDPTGRNYDKNGKEFKWDEQMDKEYMSRADCFLKQYSSFSLEAKNGTVQVDGNKTLDENISDCTGIHNLYKAYKSWRKKKETPDARIPGLEDYTEDQMFFLSTATAWCESIRPSYLIQRLTMDEHSAGRIRVLGGLSNSEEFAKAFSCPVGSKMNPEEKCNIWQ